MAESPHGGVLGESDVEFFSAILFGFGGLGGVKRSVREGYAESLYAGEGGKWRQVVLKGWYQKLEMWVSKVEGGVESWRVRTWAT